MNNGPDIVEGLVTAPYMTSALRREAAEEIERLRNALAQSVGSVKEQLLEIEHLRGALVDHQMLQRFRRWRDLLEPYQFSGNYGDYNNEGVQSVIEELDQLLKEAPDAAAG